MHTELAIIAEAGSHTLYRALAAMEQGDRDKVNRKRQFSVDRAAVPAQRPDIQTAGDRCVVL